MSDESVLVERATNGDKSAFAALVDLYEKPIYNLAYRMLGETTEAQDAAQEAFLRAYTRLNSYNPERPFKTWLFSIASHHCIDRLRKRRIVWLSLDGALPPHPALSDGRPGPEEAVVRTERRELIRQLLGRLKPKDRLMIILRYWYDHSYEEIADETGATVSAVKSRLHRARNVLAAALGEPSTTTPPAVLVES